MTKRWKCPGCKIEMMTDGSVRSRYHGDCGKWMKCVEEVETRQERMTRIKDKYRIPPEKKIEIVAGMGMRKRSKVVFECDEADLPRFGYFGEGGKA